MQPHRMAIILLHELLDGQEMRAILKTEMFGQPDLLIEG